MPPLYGAYGLALSRPPVGPEWWVEAPPHWTPWSFEWSPLDPVERSCPAEDPDRVTIHLHDAIAVYRPGEATTTIHTADEPAPHSLVHPHFGQTAVAHAWSQGWSAFHAGAVAVDGAVWAVLGDRGFGKSSALAWLLCSGLDVFADDLLVFDGKAALAGPRSLDLREGAATHFALGTEVGVIGPRRRWRAHLGPVGAELPLAGWVLLQWRPGAPQVTRAGTRECLLALISASALLGVPASGPRLLELASLPMLVFGRPQNWSAMDAAMELLLGSLTAGDA